MELLLVVHIAVTLMLVGLIWVVQLVIYPQLEQVGHPYLRAYHDAYTRRIGWVVGPLMLAELATALLLVTRWADVGIRSSAEALGAGALVGLVWISTATVQVPLHRRIGVGDRSALAPLVRSNWIRTVLWTVRGVWVATWIGRAA